MKTINFFVSLLLAVITVWFWYFVQTKSLVHIQCNDIMPRYLLKLPYESATTDNIRNILANRRQVVNIGDNYISSGFYKPSDLSVLSWRVEESNGFYNLEFLNGILINAEVYNSIRGDDILRCFGEPDFYEIVRIATNHTPRLRIQFWYPKQGMIISSVGPSNIIAQMNPYKNRKFHLIRIVKPSNPYEMGVYNYSLTIKHSEKEELSKRAIERLSPWPGDWNQLKRNDCIVYPYTEQKVCY